MGLKFNPFTGTFDWVNPTSAGASNGTIVAKYRVSASTANSSLAAGGTEFVDWDTSVISSAQVERDGSSYWRYRVPADKEGDYLIRARVYFSNATTWVAGESIELLCKKNTNYVDSELYIYPRGASEPFLLKGMYPLADLVEDDLIEFDMSSSGGNAKTLFTGGGVQFYSTIEIVWLGGT